MSVEATPSVQAPVTAPIAPKEATAPAEAPATAAAPEAAAPAPAQDAPVGVNSTPETVPAEAGKKLFATA